MNQWTNFHCPPSPESHGNHIFSVLEQFSSIHSRSVCLSHLLCLACSCSPLLSVSSVQLWPHVLSMSCPPTLWRPATLSSYSSLPRATRIHYLPLRWEEVTLNQSLSNVTALTHAATNTVASPLTVSITASITVYRCCFFSVSVVYCVRLGVV